MKSLFFAALLPFLFFAPQVKKQDIIGVWQLVRISLNGEIQLNKEDTQKCIDWSLTNLRKSRPGYSREDSIRVVRNVLNGKSKIDSITIDFRSNGELIKRDLTTDIYTLSEKPDTTIYSIDEHTGILSIGKNSRQLYPTVLLHKERLKMTYDAGDVVIVAEWQKR